ncbi:hypothetical protein I6B53_10720 [Schaalia sp. 19OD2882]|uniref:hypothetical protein n=1 Tax=Schaalia sp. 19OD2882 TaxID=2794089 RepID=UPI001C1F0BD2|nr:hypothetical protein [Schaalia sp. 19OD2882]QWW19530.1 hypothetical protein I6B53_10720 [Schaalia sp. 19OD2882]
MFAPSEFVANARRSEARADDLPPEAPVPVKGVRGSGTGAGAESTIGSAAGPIGGGSSPNRKSHVTSAQLRLS